MTDDDEMICDKKINFAKKAFDAVEDVLEMTHPRNNTSESIQEGCTSEVQEYTNEEIKKYSLENGKSVNCLVSQRYKMIIQIIQMGMTL